MTILNASPALSQRSIPNSLFDASGNNVDTAGPQVPVRIAVENPAGNFYLDRYVAPSVSSSSQVLQDTKITSIETRTNTLEILARKDVSEQWRAEFAKALKDNNLDDSTINLIRADLDTRDAIAGEITATYFTTGAGNGGVFTTIGGGQADNGFVLPLNAIVDPVNTGTAVAATLGLPIAALGSMVPRAASWDRDAGTLVLSDLSNQDTAPFNAWIISVTDANNVRVRLAADLEGESLTVAGAGLLPGHTYFLQPNGSHATAPTAVRLFQAITAVEFHYWPHVFAGTITTTINTNPGGVTPQAGWQAVVDAQVDRQFLADATTAQETADVLATVISDLKLAGVFTD